MSGCVILDFILGWGGTVLACGCVILLAVVAMVKTYQLDRLQRKNEPVSLYQLLRQDKERDQ